VDLKLLKVLIISILVLIATVSGAALKLFELTQLDQSASVPASTTVSITASISEDIPKETNSGWKIDPLGTVNVLLVGLDELDGGTRSDALAVAFFNLEKETVRVLALPRDSRVQMPGHGWDKINHAYNYGGLPLLKQTLANLLNITINYSVLFNYQSFSKMIDLLGGVDIYVDKPMRYNDFSQKLFINIPQGWQHLNGQKALEYVRFRHDPLGDIGRIQRQQKFISSVIEKLKTLSAISKIPSLVEEVVSGINTEFTPLEAIRLAKFAHGLEQGRIKFMMAPGKAVYIGSVSYWVIDTVNTSKLIVDSDADLEQETVVEVLPPNLNDDITMGLVTQIGKIGILNGDGTKGLAKRASQIFQNIGVDVPYTGDAKHHGYDSSSIVYPSEREKQAAEALAQLCGITNMALLRRDSSARMVSIILGHDKEIIFKRLENAQTRQ
jgi:LCP family protein required for cell wall assembly